METFTEVIEGLGLSDFTPLSDDTDSNGNLIRRWGCIGNMGNPITIEYYHDEFLDIYDDDVCLHSAWVKGKVAC